MQDRKPSKSSRRKQAKTSLTLASVTSYSTRLWRQGKQSKNELLGPHQNKNLCTGKETIRKTKRQLTEWDKMFANDISDKGLVSKMYNLSNSTAKKQSSEEMGKRHE